MQARQGLVRLDGIDMLRGLSILMVVVHHICLRMPFEKSALGHYLPKQLLHDIDWNGGNGVTVFFAVSGFLITSTALRRWGGLENIRIGEFYRLRFARIAPLLLLLLAVLSVLHLAGLHHYRIDPKVTSLGHAIFAALTFHLNWLEAQHGYLPANWDVLWSLSVEEMFYLFFPLLCWALRGGAWLRALLVLFVVVGPVYRLTHARGIWSDTSYLGGMDAIALGCLAAMVVPKLRMGRVGLLVMQAAGVAMMTLVLGFSRWAYLLEGKRWELGSTILPLGACLVMMAVAQTQRPGGWASAPLRWFGRNSYEVYLTHMFVVLTGTEMFVQHGSNWWWAPVWLVGMVCLAGALGALVARLYSEPMNRRLRAGMPRTLVATTA